MEGVTDPWLDVWLSGSPQAYSNASQPPPWARSGPRLAFTVMQNAYDATDVLSHFPIPHYSPERMGIAIDGGEVYVEGTISHESIAEPNSVVAMVLGSAALLRRR